MHPDDRAIGLEKDTLLIEASESATRSVSRWRIVALLFSLAITVLIFLYKDQLAQFSTHGYFGIFVVSIVGNATVVLPVPGLAATFMAGGVFNPLLVGVVSGIGMALGELSGYLAGYGGKAIIGAENKDVYKRLENWMRYHGFLTVFVLSAIPNPIFDLAGIAAGMLRFPFWRFLLACFLGKTTKGIIFALAGAQSILWFEKFLG